MSTSNISNINTAMESRNWLNLPDEVTAKILKKLGPVEILETAQKVCPSWWRICKDSTMWRCVHIKNPGYLINMQKMCRHIVDRSDGQLIEITLESFGNGELLQYIADRSSGLKCLRLVRCCIFDSGLIKAIEKLPLLEELELTESCLLIDPMQILKEVGKSLCLLNSFKLNIYEYQKYDQKYKDSCDDEALAIAANMSGLRHLQLVGNKLTDNGLRAILKGCPHLESLDLRRCGHLRLEGNLERICTNQVKSLKFPNASMDDFPHDMYYYESSDEEDYYYNDYS